MVAKQKLAITYDDVPARDSLDLVGSTWFPNLQLDQQGLDFGCVLHDASVKRQLTLTNAGRVPVSYDWAWLSGDGSGGEPPPAAELSLGHLAALHSPAAQACASCLQLLT